MKYKFIYLILICLSFFGCKEEKVEDDRGTGWLSVEFLVDKSLQTRGKEAYYDFIIQKPDGSEVVRFEDCSTFSERILLPAGTYKLVATQGNDESIGFNVPFYKGEQTVKIEAAVTKEVSIVCTQANVKVSVDYSEAITSNFPDYNLKVTTGDGELVFVKDEKRAGYLRVNEGTLVWNLTLFNGQETFHLTKTITGVLPRQYYRFTFDIKENGTEDDGAFVPGITVDTTTDIYDWVCEIVLKENMPKSEIKRQDGIALSEPVLVLEKARGAEVKIDVTSLAKMQILTVAHRSAVIKELGVPESVALTDITPEIQSALNNAGIVWGNESLLDAQQATIDFSGIANKLPLGDYKFVLSVYDARCRLVTDTLRISVIPDIDHIADEVNVMDVWAKFATIRGRWYTLVKPEGIALEYSADQVTWNAVTQTVFNDANKTFSAYLKDLEPNNTYYFRTTSTDKGASETIRQFTTEQAILIPYLNFDSWYKSSDSYFLGEASVEKWWDSGNQGANSQSWITGVNNPTAPDLTDKVDVPDNNASAKLETMKVFGVMAAGNLYTGSFGKVIGTSGASLNFGKPYTSRPTILTGYYKYKPKTVTDSKLSAIKVGTLDSCHIYIALFDSWTAPFNVNTSSAQFVNLADAMAFGELKESRTMDDFERFEIKIHYRNKTKKPTYVLMVASSSKYGDYFTGGVGSTLWIDEFELGFDPVD